VGNLSYAPSRPYPAAQWRPYALPCRKINVTNHSSYALSLPYHVARQGSYALPSKTFSKKTPFMRHHGRTMFHNTVHMSTQFPRNFFILDFKETNVTAKAGKHCT
jgi:hypothetical protein